MDEVRGGWARCCFVCRRPESHVMLVEADGQFVAGICADCAGQKPVLWAVPGALRFFFPGAALSFCCRASAGEVSPAA